MEEKIKVTVVEFGDRNCYQMQYRDPITRRKVTKSTGVKRTGKKADLAEAQRAAGKWQSELREGRYFAPSRLTWQAFRERYEKEVLASLADATFKRCQVVFNAVESIIRPERLRDITAERASYLQSKLRENGQAESTIKSSMAHLLAALNWAVKMNWLAKVPKIQMPKRAKSAVVMKGRPITGEEFDRLITKVPAGLLAAARANKKPKGTKRPASESQLAKLRAARSKAAAAAAPSWEHLLLGLFLSGLRIGEALELCWDREDKLCIDLAGKRPMLRIPAALEKGNQDRVLPIAPEFAEFLLATPAAERTGYVFNPAPQNKRSERLSRAAVIRTISAIGELAGVRVKLATETTKAKFASAHDLRRSFGERWASRVMPQVLMELMRHESIETTMRYYVGRNAQKTADVLWAAHEAAGNTSGNSGQNQPKEKAADVPQTSSSLDLT